MIKHLGAISLGVGFFALGLACGGGVDTTTSGPVAVVADAPDAHGEAKLGTFLCTEKSGDNCVDPATTFGPTTEVLYFVHQTTDIPKQGQTYTFQWIAVDVGTAAPAGTVVGALNKEVTDGHLGDLMTHYTVSSQVSKPTAGWPVGSYRVVVTLDEAAVTQLDYTIE